MKQYCQHFEVQSVRPTLRFHTANRNAVLSYSWKVSLDTDFKTRESESKKSFFILFCLPIKPWSSPCGLWHFWKTVEDNGITPARLGDAPCMGKGRQAFYKVLCTLGRLFKSWWRGVDHKWAPVPYLSYCESTWSPERPMARRIRIWELKFLNLQLSSSSKERAVGNGNYQKPRKGQAPGGRQVMSLWDPTGGQSQGPMVRQNWAECQAGFKRLKQEAGENCLWEYSLLHVFNNNLWFYNVVQHPEPLGGWQYTNLTNK